MKYNKALMLFALCAAIPLNMSLCSEEPLLAPQSQSYWQQYAPQRMQDLSDYISQKATSAYDTVSKWSTKKKLAVASTIIGTLAAVYNRDQIMQWVSGLLDQSLITQLNLAIAQYVEVKAARDHAKDMYRIYPTEENLLQLENANKALLKEASRAGNIGNKAIEMGRIEESDLNKLWEPYFGSNESLYPND